MSAPIKIRAVVVDGPADEDTLALIREAIASPSLSVVFAKVSLADVVDQVLAGMGVSHAEMQNAGLQARGLRARYAIVWLAYRVTTFAGPAIGRAINRGEEAAERAFPKADALRRRDPAFRALTDRLYEHFTGARP